MNRLSLTKSESQQVSNNLYKAPSKLSPKEVETKMNPLHRYCAISTTLPIDFCWLWIVNCIWVSYQFVDFILMALWFALTLVDRHRSLSMVFWKDLYSGVLFALTFADLNLFVKESQCVLRFVESSCWWCFDSYWLHFSSIKVNAFWEDL